MSLIHVLVDANNEVRRYWPELTPVLVSLPIPGEEPLADIKRLRETLPTLGQPIPPGDEYAIAKILLCDACKGEGTYTGLVLDVGDIDEEGRPNTHMNEETEPCDDCGGDGLFKVSWSIIPAVKLFPKR